MQVSRIRVGTAIIAAATLFMLGVPGAVAQGIEAGPNFHSGSATGIGYTAVFPSALAGAGVWHIFGTGRIGAFADAKMTQPSVTRHANYCPPALQPCDVESAESQYNHYLVEDITEWMIINAGALYAFTPEFALMFGAGMARQRRLREFADDAELPENRITWEGNYFAPYAEGDVWGAQVAAAMLIRAGQRVAFSFGYETGPGTMNAGIFLVLH